VHRDNLAGAERVADSVVITDSNAVIQYVNPAFLAQTGYSSEEVVGLPMKILNSGTQSLAFYEELWSTIRSGRTWRGELVNRRKDGTLYREEMQISPVDAGNGDASNYIAIKRDLTTLREDEEAQSFLAAIIEGSEAAIIAYTPEGMILTWNRGAASIFGYTADQTIGKHLSMLLVPERVGRLPEFTERIMQGDAIPQYESVCLRQGGRRIHVSVVGSPIRNKHGEVVAVSLIVRDISEHKRVEDALRDSEERFRIMADGCPMVMWVTDAEGGIRFINRAFRQLLGTRYEQMEGLKWQRALHPDDAPAYVEAFQRAVRDHTAFDAETRVRNAAGDWRWFATHAEPRISGEGEFLGHVGVSPDITERRHHEDALRYQYSLIRAIHEASPDGILVVNDRNVIVSHNQKLLDVWRIPLAAIPENLPDHEIGDQSPLVLSAVLARVKDPEAFLARIHQLNGGPEVDDHREIELRDGRTLERYSTRLGGEGDGHRGRVWFFRDVTESKEAAERLRGSEEKFRQLAENIDEVFWMMDPRAEAILYVSPAYEQIWGRKCESLYADREGWIQSIHPEDRSQALNTFSRQLLGEILESEYRIMRPSGDIRWIRDRAFPVRDHEGNIVRLAGIAQDITERKISELRLVHQGLHDELTGLSNRRLFCQKLEQALAHEQADGKTGAVFFIDLDRFKLVNDTLGHAAGDELLKAVARRWQTLPGVSHSLARFGGDEFTVFAAGLDGAEAARSLGESMIGCLNEPFRIGDQDVFVGASIGISLFPANGTEASALMRCADVALHEAKRDGKKQLKFYTAELAGVTRGRLGMETRLRKALANSEFRLQFQPQFAGGQSRPARLEALIRWYPPNHLPVPPLEFIPVAEQNGLIVPIGTWVLEEACRRCAAWQTGNLRGVGVAVNVSASQFACADFTGVVIRALETTGLSPKLLELELTESVFLHDMNTAIRTLQKLREMEVTIALDDFGTGYSSLSYLQKLPLDALKVDRSFLAETEGTRQGPAVLRCLVELAHAHGLRVVAEGVETVTQRDLLNSLGCDELQGFLLGMPSFDTDGFADPGADCSLSRTDFPWHELTGYRL
jgi:diguanylate cyclase (GGDEF)-like protein/PAS domain S-box-containing protein